MSEPTIRNGLRNRYPACCVASFAAADILGLRPAARGGVIHRHRDDALGDVYVPCAWHRRRDARWTPIEPITCPICFAAAREPGDPQGPTPNAGPFADMRPAHREKDR